MNVSGEPDSSEVGTMNLVVPPAAQWMIYTGQAIWLRVLRNEQTIAQDHTIDDLDYKRWMRWHKGFRRAAVDLNLREETQGLARKADVMMTA